MGDDSEWMKLPIDQKCEHKVGDTVWVWPAVYLCCDTSMIFLYRIITKLAYFCSHTVCMCVKGLKQLSNTHEAEFSCMII